MAVCMVPMAGIFSATRPPGWHVAGTLSFKHQPEEAKACAPDGRVEGNQRMTSRLTTAAPGLEDSCTSGLCGQFVPVLTSATALGSSRNLRSRAGGLLTHSNAGVALGELIDAASPGKWRVDKTEDPWSQALPPRGHPHSGLAKDGFPSKRP